MVVCPTFAPEQFGRPLYAADTVAWLDRAGWDVEVVTAEPRRLGVRYLAEGPVAFARVARDVHAAAEQSSVAAASSLAGS